MRHQGATGVAEKVLSTKSRLQRSSTLSRNNRAAEYESSGPSPVGNGVFISPGRKSGGRWQNDTILFRDDTPFAYMNIFRARFVSGHRLQPCRQRCKIVIPRRNGAISGKPDGPVAVAPHGRVGQYWRQNGTAEADVLIQTSPIIRDLLAGCVWRWTLL